MPTRIDDEIPAALDGERVDRVVALLSGLSRSVVAGLIDTGAVTVGARPVRSASRRVTAGEVLGVAIPDPVDPRPRPDPSVPFDVRLEDPHLLVVNKPAGVVVHPGAGNDQGTLVHGLVDRFPDIAEVGEPHRPGIVHRLDRGTSGLLVVARTEEVHAALVAMMAAHEPERIYAALVWGRVESAQGTIDAPIGRSPRHPTRMAVSDQGRRAVTHYEVVRHYRTPRPTTLLTCRLETGRTHQIRVHLRAIGHPIVGDREYDGGRPGVELGRPFLHAGELRFTHPVTGVPVAVTEPLPADLVACLAECG